MEELVKTFFLENKELKLTTKIQIYFLLAIALIVSIAKLTWRIIWKN